MHGKRCYLRKIHTIIRRMENYFKRFTVEYVDRTKNTKADELARVTARKIVLQPDVFLQTSRTPL
jgi:hypothetical protein